MFSFFNKTKKINIGEIVINDMHSHILPGIDDGAVDLDTSIALLNGMIESGFKTFTGTPHIMAELHKNDRNTIETAHNGLTEKLKHINFHHKIRYAAEYMVDEQFPELLKNGDMLPIFGNTLLIETPYYHEPLEMQEILFEIETAGYKAILAHPERYHYMDNQLKVLQKYIDRGFDLQVNILSLTGYYGPKEKEMAERLLEAGIVQYLGSDIHHERHMKRILNFETNKNIAKILENTQWKNHDLKD